MKRKAAGIGGARLKRSHTEGAAEDDADGMLAVRNKRLATEMHKFKRTISELQERLAASQADAASCRGVVSCITRHWKQLERDIQGQMLAAGVAPAQPAEGAKAGEATGSESGGSVLDEFLAAADAGAFIANGGGAEHAVDAGQLFVDKGALGGDEDGDTDGGGAGGNASGTAGNDDNAGGDDGDDDDEDDVPKCVDDRIAASCAFTKSLLRGLLAQSAKAKESKAICLDARLRTAEAEAIRAREETLTARRHAAQLRAEQLRIHAEKHAVCRELDQLRQGLADGEVKPAAAAVSSAADTAMSSSSSASASTNLSASSSSSSATTTASAAPAAAAADGSGTSESESAQLREQLATAKQESSDRADEIQALRLQMQSAQQKHTKETTKLKEPEVIKLSPYCVGLLKIQRRLEEDLEEVRSQLQTERSKRVDAENAAAKSRKESESWATKADKRVQAAVQDVQDQNIALSKELGAAREFEAQVQKSDAEAQRYRQRAEGAKEQIARQAHEKHKLKEQLAQLKKQWEEAAAKVRDTDEAAAAALDESQLRKSHVELLQSLGQWKERINKAEEDEAELYKELDEASRETHKARHQVNELKEAIGVAKSRNKALISDGIKSKREVQERTEYAKRAEMAKQAAERALALSKVALEKQRAAKEEVERELQKEKDTVLTLQKRESRVDAAERALLEAQAETKQQKAAAESALKHNEVLTKKASDAVANAARKEEEASKYQKKYQKQAAMIESSGKGKAGNAALNTLRFQKQKLEKMVACSICPGKHVGVVLKTCGHCFSREGIDQLIADRNRKCPSCGTRFSNSDILTLYFVGKEEE
eukprot:g313.t1